MLLFVRIAVVVLGTLAWIFSYALVAVGFGKSAPPWLIPIIILFGLVNVAAGIILLILEYRAETKRSVRDLQNDAYLLAAQMRGEMQDVRAKNDPSVVDTICINLYEHRFQSRVGRLAAEFKRRKIEESHFFYRFVRDGPKDEIEMWQITLALDEFANKLSET